MLALGFPSRTDSTPAVGHPARTAKTRTSLIWGKTAVALLTFGMNQMSNGAPGCRWW